MKKLAIFFVSSKNLTTFALAIPKGVLKERPNGRQCTLSSVGRATDS